MAKVEHTSDARVLVGIDISKHRHQVLIAVPGKTTTRMGKRSTRSGLGKPEALKHNLAGFWSKRISQKDRLIYKFDDSYIYIFAIGGHYDQY